TVDDLYELEVEFLPAAEHRGAFTRNEKRRDPAGASNSGRIELDMVNHTDTDKSSLLSKVLTVGSVAEPATLESLPEMSLASRCDIAEFRVDAWPHLAIQGVERARTCPVPVIATARRPDEGGRNALSS